MSTQDEIILALRAVVLKATAKLNEMANDVARVAPDVKFYPDAKRREASVTFPLDAKIEKESDEQKARNALDDEIAAANHRKNLNTAEISIDPPETDEEQNWRKKARRREIIVKHKFEKDQARQNRIIALHNAMEMVKAAASSGNASGRYDVTHIAESFLPFIESGDTSEGQVVHFDRLEASKSSFFRWRT